MVSKRNQTIELLRFFFAVVIVLYHGRVIFPISLFPSGYLAVEFFFIVSGYMMVKSSKKQQDSTMSWGKNTFMFIKHKALRLMPNIYIAYLIAFVVRHLSGSKVHSITVDIMNSLGELSLTSLTGFFTLRGSYSYMNGPTWYLSAMLLAMAIIYPIMLKFKENFFYYIAPMGFIFLLGITYQNYDNFDQMVITWNGYFNSGLLRGLMGILGGAMVYQFVQYLQKKSILFLCEYCLLLLNVSCICLCSCIWDLKKAVNMIGL